MTWFRTDYLSSERTDDLFPDRISILTTNGWPPFRANDPFPNRISIFRTNYLLRKDSLHLNGLFTRIPRTNDSPYDWLPVRMTPWTKDSRTKDLSPCLLNNEVCRCRKYFCTKYTLILRMYPLRQGEKKPRVITSNKNLCMFLVSRNGNNILIRSWNNSHGVYYMWWGNQDPEIKKWQYFTKSKIKKML